MFPPNPAKAAPQSLWTRHLLDLLAIQFLFGIAFSTFYLLPEFLKLELSASATEIGVVSGLGLLATVAASPLAGWWLARGDRRSPALVGSGLLALSCLGFLTVDRIGIWLLALRVLQGIAFSLTFAAVVTRASEIGPEQRLGQLLGYLGLAMLLTNALGPALAEFLAHAFGWRLVFGQAALWALGAAWVSLRVQSGRATGWSVAELYLSLRHADRGRILYASVVMGMALGVMFTFTQPFALERGAERLSALFSGYVLSAATVRLLFATLADRAGRRRVSRWAMLAYAGVVTVSAALTPSTLFVLGIGLGVVHGLAYPALLASLLEEVTASDRGILVTAFNASFSLGYAVSLFCLGPVADHWGYPALFVSCGIFSLSGAWALRGQGRPRRRDLAPPPADTPAGAAGQGGPS